MRRTKIILILVLISWVWATPLTAAQETTTPTPTAKPSGRSSADVTRDEPSEVTPPAKVDVAPIADDQQIAGRLSRIMKATDWYREVQVHVDEGVVFLRGGAKREDQKQWAGDLARNTQDVVAVVNQLRVAEQPLWDLSPAWKEADSLGRTFIQSLPLLALALVIVILAWIVSGFAIRWSQVGFNYRFRSQLLSDVASRAVAISVFFLGLYLALRVTGLTQIAATLLGGTGLVGLVIGIAFRDIAENFLASVLISVQRPFALGDQIEIDGHSGLVQSVTMRGTLLMTLNGNHVQIPNSAVYKSTIRNLTANPKQRQQFDIGISYSDSISDAQEIILKVIRGHEAVLDDPESMVLADLLGPSSVQLRAYFWIDGMKHSPIKVRSSLIRLVKRALEDARISLPLESREITIAREIPIRLVRDSSSRVENSRPSNGFSAREHASSSPRTMNARVNKPMSSTESTQAKTDAEGGLQTEVAEIEQQAREARQPEDGTNLLADDHEREK